MNAQIATVSGSIVRITERPFGNTASFGIIDEARGTMRFMGLPDDDDVVRLEEIRNSTQWGWCPATGRIPGYVRNAAGGRRGPERRTGRPPEGVKGLRT